MDKARLAAQRSRPPVFGLRLRLRLANDGAVHAIGIESARTFSSGVHDVEHLRRGAWDAQSIAAGDIVGSGCSWRNVERIYGGTGHMVLNARQPDGAGMLSFRRQNRARCRQIGLAADQWSSPQVA